MVKEKLRQELKQVVEDLGFLATDIVCDIPKNPIFGDYSTNVALQLAKLPANKDKQSPVDIANQILEKFGRPDYLEKAEIAGGGFINFFIKDQTLVNNLEKIEGMTHPKEGKEKIIVEFTDTNPFKEFHIGHVFSNTVGESVSRLFENSGAIVWRGNFFGDVGMHVAKAIYGIRKKTAEEGINFDDLGKRSLIERIKFMGQAYALGAAAYEEEKAAQEEMKKLNLLIFVAAQQYWKETKNLEPKVDYRKYIGQVDENLLKEIKHLWTVGRGWSLEYFETLYAILGTKFDGYYPESLTGEVGYEFVMEGLKKGIFEESEGAVVYKGEKHGLHTRVFINKLGLPTYETKDIGNAPLKYSEFKYDKSLIVSANEIDEYFKVVLAAMREINPQLGKKTIHLGHGVVRLTGGKMSSRTGKVLTFDELLEAVSQKIEPLVSDSVKEARADVVKKVGVGAIKFAMLKHQPQVDTIFDLDKSVALEGDSGPYVQYTYARAKSLLKNANLEKMDGKQAESLEKEERQLLKRLEYFQESVEEATQSLHPNAIASFLLELASDFNLFYQKHRILDAQESKKALRLSLTKAVAAVLKHGLYLLGIEAPERM